VEILAVERDEDLHAYKCQVNQIGQIRSWKKLASMFGCGKSACFDVNVLGPCHGSDLRQVHGGDNADAGQVRVALILGAIPWPGWAGRWVAGAKDCGYSTRCCHTGRAGRDPLDSLAAALPALERMGALAR